MRKSHDSDSHSTCSVGGGGQRKRGLSRFSLRRLLYSSPLVTRRITRGSGSTKSSRSSAANGVGPSRDVERGDGPSLRIPPGSGIIPQATSRTSVSVSGSTTKMDVAECPLCLSEYPLVNFPELSTCTHRSCYDCFQQYLRIEISESRVSIACPECAEPMHPDDIRMILNDKALYEKYEDFMVRRVLAVDPDTRWCPAPDCSFAVIATGCASCPKIKCERPGCDAYFCYHCKAEWHPNQTCDAARAQRSPNVRSSSISFSQDSQHRDDIKPCPRCQVLIVKMDDGSCNHMTCSLCCAEFCWLCMKEISDLHYLSPSGCTFWGKKPWSRKKKILWQLGTLVGAPVGIGLVAGIAVPAMIIGIPVWVGRKLYARYEQTNKHKRNLAIAGGVTASVLVSPVLAGLAVGIGVPILLFYVYGVVPVSLCRSGGCGVSTSGAGVRFEFDDENDILSGLGGFGPRGTDAVSMDAVSHRGANPSIGEASLSLGSGSGSQLERVGGGLSGGECGSNAALAGASIAGSIASGPVQRLEIQADVASTQRLSTSSETASLSEQSQSLALSEGTVPRSEVTAPVPVEVHAGAESTSLQGAVLPPPSPEESMSRRHTYRRSRPPLDRQASDSSGRMTGGDDCSSERVRFDDHVSFITPPLTAYCETSEDDESDIVGRRPTRHRTTTTAVAEVQELGKWQAVPMISLPDVPPSLTLPGRPVRVSVPVTSS